jgi:hypothetical protein
MANRKRIPPEPPRPTIPGGATRPSLRVSLSGHRAIARRRALNTRLLSATCAFGKPSTSPLTALDVELLQRITAERFSGEQAALRMQAVRELGRAESIPGVAQLASLATSPADGEQVRAAAAAALKQASPQIARAVLSGLARDPSRLVQQTATRIEESAGRTRPKRKRRTPAADARR